MTELEYIGKKLDTVDGKKEKSKSSTWKRYKSKKSSQMEAPKITGSGLARGWVEKDPP